MTPLRLARTLCRSLILVAAFGALVARADTIITGTINFTVTGCSFPPCSVVPTGSFTYDSSTFTFTYFTVTYDGATYDFVNHGNANNPQLSGSEACLSGATGGAAATFALLTSCSGAWQELSGPQNSGFGFGDGHVAIGALSSTGSLPSENGTYTVSTPCSINFNVQPKSGGACSTSGLFTEMTASFTPGSSVTLDNAATACGFVGFDWVQTINLSPGGVFAENAPRNPLKAPPPHLDPAQSSYTYNYPCNSSNFPECDPFPYLRTQWLKKYLPNFDSNPFYYNPSDILSTPSGCAVGIPPPGYRFCDPRLLQLPQNVINQWLSDDNGCAKHIVSNNDTTLNTTLNFSDAPQNQMCSYPKPCFNFTTQLVGICNGPSPAPACSSYVPGGPQYQPSAPFVGWTWSSNFNADRKTCTGGLGPVAVTANSFPPDPGSGTGGVTITGINGVPQTPPSITCTATPNALWPPDGKSVEVTVSGTVTPGTQVIPVGGTTYAVTDEYGLVQPSGSFTADAGGSYSFRVPLIAVRNGNDLDGRTYTINVIATDNIGNVGSCSGVVTAPHDQGN